MADYLLGRHKNISDHLFKQREKAGKKMASGLDSKVGRLFEGGHGLSGGEWQRLALARIMYRNADIWILDEPTSSHCRY